MRVLSVILISLYNHEKLKTSKTKVSMKNVAYYILGIILVFSLASAGVYSYFKFQPESTKSISIGSDGSTSTSQTTPTLHISNCQLFYADCSNKPTQIDPDRLQALIEKQNPELRNTTYQNSLVNESYNMGQTLIRNTSIIHINPILLYALYDVDLTQQNNIVKAPKDKQEFLSFINQTGTKLYQLSQRYGIMDNTPDTTSANDVDLTQFDVSIPNNTNGASAAVIDYLLRKYGLTDQIKSIITNPNWLNEYYTYLPAKSASTSASAN